MTLNGGMGMVRCGEQADELLQQTQAEAGVGAALRALPDRAAFAVALLNRVHAQCSPFLHPTEPLVVVGEKEGGGGNEEQ